MVKQYCQSCGIPIGFDQGRYGHNQDGSDNHDYCSDCFQDGKFTHDLTLKQMVDISFIYLSEVHPELDKVEAKKELETTISQLKRWKK